MDEPGLRRVASASVRPRDVAIAACAASALVHAALVPAHYGAQPFAAVSFAAASAALLALALALTRPTLQLAPLGGAVLFASLIVAYPVVHAFTGEGIDALGIGTKLVEGVGLVASLLSIRDPETAIPPLDVITGVFIAMVLLSFGHHHA